MATGPSLTAEKIAEESGVPRAKLDEECSKEHINEISLFLTSWKTLAPHLYLEDTDIEEIDQDGKTEQEKKLKTLQKWKERFIFQATYKVLMEALLKIGKADRVRKVCHLLQSPAIGSPATGHGNTDLGEVTVTTPPMPESPPSSSVASPHQKVASDQTVVSVIPPSAMPVQTPRITTNESLKSKIHELEKEFDGLVDRAGEDIENAIENGELKLSRVQRSIARLPVSQQHLHIKFLQGKLSAINEAKNVNGLFSILDRYWDFMNCGLLQLLIDRFGRSETQLRMESYLKRLTDFRSSTSVREFTDTWTGNIPSNLAEFVMEMGEEWMDRSLEAVEEFRIKFSRQCAFEDYALPVKKSEHNSVILHFALQRSFHMSTELLQPARQFLQKQGVLRVFFKGDCLLDLRPPQAIPSMEVATGGSDLPAQQGEEYESQTSMEPKHISSEEGEEVDDRLHQSHGQQQAIPSMEVATGGSDIPAQQGEEYESQTSMEPKHISSEEGEEVDDCLHQSHGQQQAIPSMEVATGGSDIPAQQGEEYESQTSMEPKHISSEEGEEVDDCLHQSHGQQQAIPSMEVATGGSDIPTQQGEEYESQTSMEPKHISSEEGEEVDDRLHQSHGQQQAIPSMEVATGGSDIPAQQGEEYESQTSMEPKHISSEEGEEVDDRPHQSHGQQQVNLENPLAYLEWEDYTTLPVGMQHAQAVVVGNKVYMGGGMTTDAKDDTNIYVFDHMIERPPVTSIPTPGPTRWSTLATFHSQLVLAGGTTDGMKATNKLWALKDDGCSWERPFPPMPQACWGASAISSGEHLILAGGVGSDHPLTSLDTVQIYNASSKKWVLSKPLPNCCYFMKSILLNGDWYLAGGRWQYSKVFHASLESLIETSDKRKKGIWKSLPQLFRRRCCSISACHGQLMAVGGVTNSGPTREIQVYSTKKRSWIEVEYMPNVCDSTCTIVLPTKEILLIGGNTLSESQQHNFSDCVTKASTNVIHSLDDKFSQYALKHIELTAGISVYHYFMSDRMNANKGNEWLLGDFKKTHDQPATWIDLLRHLRDRGMYDVANDIELLFTNKPESPPPSLQPANKQVLNTNILRYLRDEGMFDEVDYFERLITEEGAPESPHPSSAHGTLTPTSLSPGHKGSTHESYLGSQQQVKPMPTDEEVQDTKLKREYELKEELGRGGFGVVYHVKKMFDGGQFALKITKLPKLKRQQDKVMCEVHALVTLDHPRILRYYTSWPARVTNAKVLEALKSHSNPTMACAEYAAYAIASADDSLSPDPHPDDEENSSEQDLPYCLHIQTQLCNKDTLKDWLKNNKQNRQKKTVFGFFEQIHDAVVYIHQKGLLHRDLSPSNVFFSLEGGSVKVGDFGLVAGVNVDDDTMKCEGQQKHSHRGKVGKWLYMPPEQRAGKNYDEKVDIYALGVIFFELNCPFSTSEQRLQVLKELQSQKNLPSTFSKRLPAEARLIELMLASDPTRRPSAKEISDSDCLNILGKTIERSGTELIPLHPSAGTLTRVHKTLTAASKGDSGLARSPSHSLTESQYPGVHLLEGSPWRESVTSVERKISWDDIGIQFDIPAGAIPGGKVLHLNVWPCLSGRFILPDGCDLASPVFMISPEFKFRKEIMMSMIHFMDLQSEDACERMVFISAPSVTIDQDGKPEYHFKVSDKGVFHIGQRNGSIALNHFCAFAIARKRRLDEAPTDHSNDTIHGRKRKRDEGTVLYSIQLYQAPDKVLFSIAIYHPVYDKSLRSALEKECPGAIFQHSAKAPVIFSDDVVSLGIPTDSMSGWGVIPDITPSQISKDEVDLPLRIPDYAINPNHASETSLIYPPRVWLTLVRPQVTPHTRTRTCVLPVHGLTKSYSFNIQLKSTAQAVGSAADVRRLPCKPNKIDLMNRVAVQASTKWRAIGLELGVETHELNRIEKEHVGDLLRCSEEIFDTWEKQSSDNMPYTWTTIIKALRAPQVNEIKLASGLEKEFS